MKKQTALFAVAFAILSVSNALGMQRIANGLIGTTLLAGASVYNYRLYRSFDLHSQNKKLAELQATYERSKKVLELIDEDDKQLEEISTIAQEIQINQLYAEAPSNLLIKKIEKIIWDNSKISYHAQLAKIMNSIRTHRASCLNCISESNGDGCKTFAEHINNIQALLYKAQSENSTQRVNYAKPQPLVDQEKLVVELSNKKEKAKYFSWGLGIAALALGTWTYFAKSLSGN